MVAFAHNRHGLEAKLEPKLEFLQYHNNYFNFTQLFCNFVICDTIVLFIVKQTIFVCKIKLKFQ